LLVFIFRERTCLCSRYKPRNVITRNVETRFILLDLRWWIELVITSLFLRDKTFKKYSHVMRVKTHASPAHVRLYIGEINAPHSEHATVITLCPWNMRFEHHEVLRKAFCSASASTKSVHGAAPSLTIYTPWRAQTLELSIAYTSDDRHRSLDVNAYKTCTDVCLFLKLFLLLDSYLEVD
jgi:hypothetical protein